jgi:hydrogenase expression/formation protein HypE
MSEKLQRIQLVHGDGSRAMRRLIREQIVPLLENPHLRAAGDAAALPAPSGPLVFSTDSYVVSPLFFPGGDIGRLAVYGTVNDLAVAGARPRWLSLSLILEEGFPLETVRRVLESIAAAAERAKVQIVTGDTKVVPRGAADGMFINTAGIGELLEPAPPGPAAIRPGDQLILSGPIGCHGMAVLIAREQIDIDPAPTSDCAPLADAVEALWRGGVPVRAMRDATRGGVTAVLHEWAEAAECGFTLDESRLPDAPQVRGACELLGLEPLNLANEGTMLVAVPLSAAELALAALHAVQQTAAACIVGEARPRGTTAVSIRRTLGREQPLHEPVGSPLPRIC